MLRLASLLLVLLVGLAHRADAQQGAGGPATLSGIVRDSLGEPIPGADVLLVGTRVGTRAGADGRFLLERVPPGDHVIRFRHLGYTSVEVDWSAQPGQGVELSVRLDALPRGLDPVIVRAREERAPSGRSLIAGVVVDSAGEPVPEAVVSLVGAGRTTMTTAEGSFVFRRLADGDYVVRVRRLGWAPGTYHLRLEKEDERQVTLRLHRLARTLDTVRVVERSGFGALETVFQDLERRQRWRSGRAVSLVGEDLRALGRMGLDDIVRFKAGLRPAAASKVEGPGVQPSPGAVKSMSGAASIFKGIQDPGSVCVLENGRTPKQMPLAAYGADQVERIEIYPPDSELTGTVQERMGSLMACMGDFATRRHPLYVVVWLKGEG